MENLAENFDYSNQESNKKEGKIIYFENEKRLELFKKAEKVAKGLYGDIPYHNFNHASEALESGYEIVARCQASNIEVDSDVIRYSILFHDAGYHENHEEKGFENKEEYSAYLAEKSLRSIGVSEEIIGKVKSCIVSTHKDAEFNTTEEKIVRAADLVGLAGEYEYFRDNAMKLKEEAEMMSGNKISLEDWKRMVGSIIGFYLSQDIRLTECYRDEEGGSRFHKKTRSNLDRFLAE